MQANRIAQRLAGVAPFHVMELLARAKELEAQGRHIVHMEIGEPDFPTPDNIKKAAIDAINSNFTKYTPSAGVMELREAVAHRYKVDYGVDFKPEEVIITAGAKQALYNTAMGFIGGLTPLGAEWLIHRTSNDLSPAWMLMGAAAISLVATLFQPETYRDRLQTSAAPA